MNIKKVAGLSILCLGISLNASFISAIIGPDTSSDNYVPKERGIIAHQDVDGDGIIDSEDDCLETNPCTGKGCEEKKAPMPPKILDSDKDGVLDDKDKCPDTPLGFEVDEDGCSKVVDLSVLFDVDKYDIKKEFSQKIDDVINFLDKHPTYSVVIQGHTDSDGSDEHNITLSQNRATSVKNYILDNSDIDKQRVITEWFGESQPLNDNATKEEKQENRRVIAIFNK